MPFWSSLESLEKHQSLGFFWLLGLVWVFINHYESIMIFHLAQLEINAYFFLFFFFSTLIEIKQTYKVHFPIFTCYSQKNLPLCNKWSGCQCIYLHRISSFPSLTLSELKNTFIFLPI